VFCILEGAVLTSTKRENDNSKAKSYLLLFTDQVVVVKRLTDRHLEFGAPKKGKNLYHKTYRFSDAHPIPLGELKGDAIPLPDSLGFALEFETEKSVFRIFVKTLDEKRNWVREINKARKAYLDSFTTTVS